MASYHTIKVGRHGATLKVDDEGICPKCGYPGETHLDEWREKDNEEWGYLVECPVRPEVGMGITWTVHEVSKGGRLCRFSADDAKLSPDFKPKIILGGFAGHCTNQNEQTYQYTPRPDLPRYQARLTKNGWVCRKLTSKRLRLGVRGKFHDYNF